MTGPSPTVRRRQLGMELRRLREAAGRSQQEAGDWLGIPATSISKIEHFKQKITLSHLRLLLQFYEVGSPHADFLFQLQRESNQRGWWADLGRAVPKYFDSFLGMESAAKKVNSYESEFVPGLFQTPEYIEAINVALSPDRTPDEIRQLVELRVSRQQRLNSSEDPLILHTVINEAALRREVGGTDVMRAQIHKLAELAALPNVTMQVLPFSAGAHPGMRGSFTLLQFPEEPMNTVYLELYGAAYYVEVPADVRKYADRFEQLARQSSDTSGTVEVLNRLRGGPDGTPDVAQE